MRPRALLDRAAYRDVIGLGQARFELGNRGGERIDDRLAQDVVGVDRSVDPLPTFDQVGLAAGVPPDELDRLLHQASIDDLDRAPARRIVELDAVPRPRLDDLDVVVRRRSEVRRRRIRGAPQGADDVRPARIAVLEADEDLVVDVRTEEHAPT